MKTHMYIYNMHMMLYPNPRFAAMFSLSVPVLGVRCAPFGRLSKRANTRANMQLRDKP